jgi:hypothetical protein
MENQEILDHLASIEKKRKLSMKEKEAIREAATKIRKANTRSQWMKVLEILAKLLL